MTRRITRLQTTKMHMQTIKVQISRLRCPVCERDVGMVSRAQATGILEIDSPTFDRLLAVGCIHTVQTVSGTIRICKDSLFQNRR
jgi:hypothetical protein